MLNFNPETLNQPDRFDPRVLAEYIVDRAISFSLLNYVLAVQHVMHSTLKHLKAFHKKYTIDFKHIPEGVWLDNGTKSGDLTYKMSFVSPKFKQLFLDRYREDSPNNLNIITVPSRSQGFSSLLLLLSNPQPESANCYVSYLESSSTSSRKYTRVTYLKTFLQYAFPSLPSINITDQPLYTLIPKSLNGNYLHYSCYQGNPTGLQAELDQVVVSVLTGTLVEDKWDKVSKFVWLFEDRKKSYINNIEAEGQKSFDRLPGRF